MPILFCLIFINFSLLDSSVYLQSRRFLLNRCKAGPTRNTAQYERILFTSIQLKFVLTFLRKESPSSRIDHGPIIAVTTVWLIHFLFICLCCWQLHPSSLQCGTYEENIVHEWNVVSLWTRVGSSSS